jgi:hypothetical protein
MRKAHALVVITLAVPLAAAACGNLIQKSAMDTTSQILARARLSMQQESDPDLAAAAIPGALKTVEGFHIANPDNETLIAMLAEGYCQYATGFLQEEWEIAHMEARFDDADRLADRATGLFLRCMNYGLKLLPKKWSEAIYGDLDGVRKLVAKAGKGSIKGMFWTALGLGSAINLNRDDIVLVSHLPKARLMLQRIVELDSRYQNGLAHMALGMMNSAQSPAIGGNPELGREHFEKAMSITGGKFLLVKVMFAKTYGVITQNRELFRKTLVEVLQTAPSIWPEQRLANELAHRKARRYLKQEKDWF